MSLTGLMEDYEGEREGWETVKSLNIRRTNKMRKIRKENDRQSSSTN